MPTRIVLYAEGPGEDRGEDPWLPEPGELLQQELLGAAHHLVARLIEQDHGIPRAAVGFISPLRVGPRLHRGSDLLHKRTLRRLLTFASPARRPQLAVVLVDEDGQEKRKRDLEEWTADLDLPRIIGVAVREFESWLIADQKALVDVLEVKDTPPGPESMPPGEAKRLVQGWIAKVLASITGQGARGARIQQLRVELIQRSSLAALDGLAAFRAFRGDLRRAMSTIL